MYIYNYYNIYISVCVCVCVCVHVCVRTYVCVLYVWENIGETALRKIMPYSQLFSKIISNKSSKLNFKKFFICYGEIKNYLSACEGTGIWWGLVGTMCEVLF